MADYRLSAQVISRSAGRSSVAAAAYRSAARMIDERTGEIHDFRRKGGLVHEEIMAPENAPDWMQDRDQLWNAVEAVERRKDAQLAREIQLSLPHELDAEQRAELVRGFVQEQFVARGMVADLAIHEPGRSGDQRNHHAHVMLTMRELTGDGFGKKAREWNAPDLLQEQRREWADHQNRTFERLGLSVRVDHRSYEERGIDREPTQHLGPNAHEMEARGEASRIGDENRAREERNSDRANDHREAAQLKLQIEKQRQKFEFWADRKRDELGHAHELAELDLSQKHDRQLAALKGELEKTYGEHKATVTAEIENIDRKLGSTGVRKLFRDAFGRTRADRASREEFALTLESIEQRETERKTALQHRQSSDFDKEKQRQERNEHRLERGIETARKRREEDGWKPQERDFWRDRKPPPAPANSPHERDDFWSAKRTVKDDGNAAERSKSGDDFWRSTSTDRNSEDSEFLKDRWSRSANDNEPSFEREPEQAPKRTPETPSPSLGGNPSGKGSNGSGGNSGGSGGGSSGGGG